MRQYYISRGKIKYGPYLLEDMAKMRLMPYTLIWFEGSAGWKHARDVEEFKNFVFMSGKSSANAKTEHLPEIAIVNNSEDDINYWLLKTFSILLVLLFFGQVVRAIAQ